MGTTLDVDNAWLHWVGFPLWSPSNKKKQSFKTTVWIRSDSLKAKISRISTHLPHKTSWAYHETRSMLIHQVLERGWLVCPDRQKVEDNGTIERAQRSEKINDLTTVRWLRFKPLAAIDFKAKVYRDVNRFQAVKRACFLSNSSQSPLLKFSTFPFSFHLFYSVNT